jgi:hypothetical protein
MLLSIAITIQKPASINAQLSPDSKTNSKSQSSNSKSHTLAFQLSKISKLPDFASVIINLTSLPNFGPIALPLGLQICFASVFQSTTNTSFTFNSSFMISIL